MPRAGARGEGRGTKAGTFGTKGGDWIRLGYHKSKWRAVVDQLATIKADHLSTAEKSFALAA